MEGFCLRRAEVLAISACSGSERMQVVVPVGDHLARAVSVLHMLSAEGDLFL